MNPFQVYITVSYFVALVPNVVLLVLILIATPRQSRDFAVVIFHQTLNNISYSIICALLAPRLIFTHEAVVYILEGPLQHVDLGTLTYLVAIMMGILLDMVFINAIPFLHRLRIIMGKKTSVCQVVVILITADIPYLIASICMLEGISPTVILPQLNAYADIQNETGLVAYNIASAKSTYIMVLTHLGPIIVILVAVFVRWRSKSLLSSTNSTATIRMHRRLLKAFTIQACIPMLSILATSPTLLAYYNICHIPFSEYFAFGMSPVLIVLHTIISIEFISYYKTGLRKLLSLNVTSGGMVASGAPSFQRTRVRSLTAVTA